MKYQVLVSYEEQGVVTIEADSSKEAEMMVYDLMEESGLDELKFDCKGREYLTHGMAPVYD